MQSQFRPQALQDCRAFFLIHRIFLFTAVRLPLVPQHPCDSRGAAGQFTLVQCMGVKQSAHTPLIQVGTAVGAWNQPHVHIMLLCISISKAFSQIDAGGDSVTVYRHVHLAPAAVAKYQNMLVGNRFYLILESSASHI